MASPNQNIIEIHTSFSIGVISPTKHNHLAPPLEKKRRPTKYEQKILNKVQFAKRCYDAKHINCVKRIYVLSD